MKLRNRMPGRLHRVALLLALLPFTLAWGSTASAASHDSSAVYVLTNAAEGNAVAIFDRRSDGTLRPAGTLATGGLGASAGLGSQGALVLSEKNRWLFAVNAGSNDISAFEVRGGDLRLVNRIASGGERPISLSAAAAAAKDLSFSMRKRCFAAAQHDILLTFLRVYEIVYHRRSQPASVRITKHELRRLYLRSGWHDLPG